MIGLFAEHSSIFLKVVAVMTVVVFSIPITLAPLAWARVLRWTIDAQPDLARYFGRSLGAVALAMSWGAWYAADHAEVQSFFFIMLIISASVLTVIHIAGAIEKVQPWTETAEIPFWGGLALLGLLFYPAT